VRTTSIPCTTRAVFTVTFICAYLSADVGADNSNEYRKGSLLAAETQMAGEGKKGPVPGRKQALRFKDETVSDTKSDSVNDDPLEEDEEDCD